MHPFEPQFLLQGVFQGKSSLSVFSNGAYEATDKANFLIEGGQLVVWGTKRWYFERDNNDDNEKDWIYTNWTDKSGWDDGGGDGRLATVLLAVVLLIRVLLR